MAINKNNKIFEQFNREALFKKLQEQTQNTVAKAPETAKPNSDYHTLLGKPEQAKPIPIPLSPVGPITPIPLPYIPEKPKFIMPQLPDNLDDLRSIRKFPDTTHDDGFDILPEPKIPTKPKLAPELPHNLSYNFSDDLDSAITERFPWIKEPFNPTGILQKKPEIPQAEVDETQKIVVDWFGEDKLPDALAKKLAEFLSAQKHEHSPFDTAPIKVDTGSEIVRDWYEDEPEKLVMYLKAQPESILEKLSNTAAVTEVKDSGATALSNITPQKVSAATSGLTYYSAKSPFSEATNLNYGDSGNSQALHQLQKVLFENGFYGNDMPTSGAFDDTTLKAVIRFQLASNMSWDDLFDSSGRYKGVDSNTLMYLEQLYLTSTDANKHMRRNKIGGMISGGGLYGDPLTGLIIDGGTVYNSRLTKIKIEIEQMQSVFSETGHWQANSISDDMVNDLDKTLNKYGIETQEQIQMFLAVCLFESRNSLTEAGWLSEATVREYCKQYEPDTDAGKRLGNTEVGDGYKFRGAGYIQLTGRDNYQQFSDYIEKEYGYDPKIMAEGADYVEKAYPWEAAGFYWEKHNINDAIKKGKENGQDTTATFRQVSNAVNRGNTYSEYDPRDWENRLALLYNVLNVY